MKLRELVSRVSHEEKVPVTRMVVHPDRAAVVDYISEGRAFGFESQRRKLRFLRRAALDQNCSLPLHAEYSESRSLQCTQPHRKSMVSATEKHIAHDRRPVPVNLELSKLQRSVAVQSSRRLFSNRTSDVQERYSWTLDNASFDIEL